MLTIGIFLSDPSSSLFRIGLPQTTAMQLMLTNLCQDGLFCSETLVESNNQPWQVSIERRAMRRLELEDDSPGGHDPLRKWLSRPTFSTCGNRKRDKLWASRRCVFSM